MAIIKYRLKQKTSEGYDTYHLESSADLIFRVSGIDTVESSLLSLESTVNSQSTTKADKVAGATVNNFAGLDSAGNLIDSGKTAADFAIASHTHPITQVTGGSASKVPVYNTDGILSSSVISSSELEYLSGVTSGIQTQFNNVDNKFINYILTTQKGVASGVVPLNTDSKIDAAYLPSYVDDVIEAYYKTADGKFYNEAEYTTLVTGESGKIYVDLISNKTYRWSGTTFVEISTSQVIAASSTNGNININGTETSVYIHPTYNGTKTTASASVAAAGSFIAIDSITITNGHISSYEAKTYTIPGYDWSTKSTQPTNQKTGDFWLEAI